MRARVMAAGLGVAVAVAASGPALAKPGAPNGKAKGQDRAPATTSTSAPPGLTATPTATTAPGGTATATASKKGAKHFVHVGALKAVGTDSLTVVVKGGNQKAKSSTVTVTVATSARIMRNGRKVKLADLRVGDQVQAKGTGTVATDIKAERRSAGSTSTTTPSSTSSTSSTTSSTTSTTVATTTTTAT